MIGGVYISSSKLTVLSNEIRQKALPEFKENQVIPARVVKLLPRGSAHLLVDGRIISASTDLLLKPGEEIQLKVIQAKDEIILKLIDPSQPSGNRHLSKMARFFSQSGILPALKKNGMGELVRLMNDIGLKSAKADADFLPRLMEKGGLMFEKKMAGILTGTKPQQTLPDLLASFSKEDFKAGLLDYLGKQDRGDASRTDAASRILQAVENFQILNQISQDSGRMILPFPVFSDLEFRFGQLLIDRGDASGKEKTDKNRMMNVSFLLDMTSLGPLRADFSILNRAINGRFLLSDADTADYVSACLPLLKRQLSEIDFKVYAIECSVAQTEELSQNVLARSLADKWEENVLNIVV